MNDEERVLILRTALKEVLDGMSFGPNALWCVGLIALARIDEDEERLAGFIEMKKRFEQLSRTTSAKT